MNRIVYEDDRFVNYLLARREYGVEDKVILNAKSLARSPEAGYTLALILSSRVSGWSWPHVHSRTQA